MTGAGALVTSTISSEGALLSATARRERTKDATGGLLRRLGDHGLLVIKDVTSILAMNRDTRASLLAAFREIHDGKWERNVGTDGGRSLTWTGRLVIIGAVTTAWDRAHGVIASMGDRFVLVRMDSTTGRMPAGRRACQNTGEETRMRAELAAVVGGVARHGGQRRRAHSSIQVTVDIYGHMVPGGNRAAVDRLDAAPIRIPGASENETAAGGDGGK